jgi:hypothetical protein
MSSIEEFHHKFAIQTIPNPERKTPSGSVHYTYSVPPAHLCLSQRAGLSIILPTPHWKPWYRLPVTPVLNRPNNRLSIPRARA